MTKKNEIFSAKKTGSGEIVLYQPNNTVQLEVKLQGDTVWLSIDQMAALFGRDRSVVGKHVRAVFKEGELTKESVWAKFAYTASDGKDYHVDFYNLDVIISVGYRVHSVQGTRFRQWATNVLRQYMLNGYAFNQRFERLECRVAQVEESQRQFDIQIHRGLPPTEGVFFEGQIFDAYVFVTDLIKRAQKRIILIDNYIDETTLAMLSKREKGVVATIYTYSVSDTLKVDITKYNAQYEPIELKQYKAAHDRFLLIDDDVYHMGASLKDLARKLFAFAKMNELTAGDLLDKINQYPEY